MTTTDLTPAAQLYIALMWDGARLYRDDGVLALDANPILTVLYAPEVEANKAGLSLLVDKAEASDRANPEAHTRAYKLASGHANVYAAVLAYAAAVEGLASDWAAQDPAARSLGGVCDHCGRGEEGGFTLVQEALATAALSWDIAVPTVEPTPGDLVFRRLTTAKLGLSLGELGVARSRDIIKFARQFENEPPRYDHAALAAGGLERYALLAACKGKGAGTCDTALREVIREAHHVPAYRASLSAQLNAFFAAKDLAAVKRAVA